MHSRVFALIIGIDQYQSGSIWNLNSCVQDAKRVRRFLIDSLNVPKDQICLLLDHRATKKAIEDSFVAHLINNAVIERDDAIIVYFAGHGSSIEAPRDWFEEGVHSVNRRVEVLCPADHDTMDNGSRVAGISDRSMHALFSELSQVKGNNIAFIADCCFSPSPHVNGLDRSSTRWTPTAKVKPDDLYPGLWSGARGKPCPRGYGFYAAQQDSHVFLAACRPGESAVEGKNGGRFTDSFLAAATELSLHRTSYATLFDYIQQKIGPNEQRPICLGKHKSCRVFNATPFVPDPRFVPVEFDGSAPHRIEVGAVHGIAEGSEFSLHMHNYHNSRNPDIGIVVVFEVHPTWCFARLKSPTEYLPRTCWAQVSRWNNRHPFRLYLKSTFTSIFKWRKLYRAFPTVKTSRPAPEGKLNVILVKGSEQANISMTIGLRTFTVKRKDDAVARVHRASFNNRDPTDIIKDAACFDLHLYRCNPNFPLQGLVTMELYRINPASWTVYGENLLRDSEANIPQGKRDIFTIVIKNDSEFDLWPYLFYLDPVSFSITRIHPGPVAFLDKSSPLPCHSQLAIGSGQTGSEALSFPFGEELDRDFGYLKLFLTSKSVSFGIIEQGNLSTNDSLSLNEKRALSSVDDHIWDAISATLHFT